MNSKVMIVATIACATLAACGSTGRHSFFTPKTQCTTATCAIDVSITRSPTTGNCIPDGIPDLDVRTGHVGDRSISWTITTNGFEFSREDYKFGIFIESNPFGEFKNARITNAGKTLSLDFSHAKTGIDYKYALSVRRSTGQKEFCDTLDPWMIS